MSERGAVACGVDLSPAMLTATGFAIQRIVEREPYKGVEVETRRFYVLGTTPTREDASPH